MNRNEIADQVRTTLGDHVADFDVEAIVSDLVAGHDGDLTNIDVIESETYWDIVKRQDVTAAPARWQS
jgi:hypothetical protein